MATQQALVNAANNEANYLENMRSLMDQIAPSYPISALLAEMDDPRAGKSYINDLLLLEQDVSSVIAVDEASSNLGDRTYVPVPVETPMQTYGSVAAVALSSTGGALPGMAGDIDKQTVWQMKDCLKNVEKSIVSNQPSVYPTANAGGANQTPGITAGLMTYSKGVDSFELGTDAVTAYSHAGYNPATKVTQVVNDLISDDQDTRAFVSLQAVLKVQQMLYAAQSGANTMQGTEGQRSTVTEGDFICVIPQAVFPDNIVPSSGPASQARTTQHVYKKRAGQQEGLVYPMSVIYLETNFGNCFLCPALEQAVPAGNTVNNGALSFMFDPTATGIVWKTRPERKDIYAKNIQDEAAIRARYGVLGLLSNHVRMLAHCRQS